jgi:hypothetical protein
MWSIEMNRRTFLGRLVAFVGLLPFVRLKPDPRLPAITAPARGLFNPSADVARQYREGIGIRFVKGFDIDVDKRPTRLDTYAFHPDAFELAMAPFDQQQVAMCTCADWLTCAHPWPALVPDQTHVVRVGLSGKSMSTGNWCGTPL